MDEDERTPVRKETDYGSLHYVWNDWRAMHHLPALLPDPEG